MTDTSLLPRHCDYRAFRGWYCTRPFLHEGPCALWPCWWNRGRFARTFRRAFR